MGWQPRVTGDWSADTTTGRKMADQMIKEITESANPTLLGHLMKSMVGHGDWTGVEVGFFHRLSDHMISLNKVDHDQEAS